MMDSPVCPFSLTLWGHFRFRLAGPSHVAAKRGHQGLLLRADRRPPAKCIETIRLLYLVPWEWSLLMGRGGYKMVGGGSK